MYVFQCSLFAGDVFRVDRLEKESVNKIRGCWNSVSDNWCTII